MSVPPFRIELLTHISGVEFAECWAARKTTSGRPKDINDLENLP